MKFFRLIVTVALSAGLLTACGGDSPTDSGNGDGEEGGDTRVIKTSPLFGTDIQDVFDRRGCTASGCHDSSASGSLDLRSGQSYSNLVDVASAGAPSVLLVKPSDAVNSYLVMKLEGTAGARMPLAGNALDNIDMTNIKNWINTGAANN